jgi:hypothetical protein
MITRRMSIRRHLRSARTSTLTESERRQELREAEERHTRHHGRDKAAEPSASPRAAGDDSASGLREASAERAGVREID